MLLEGASVVFSGGRVDVRGGGGASAACFDGSTTPDEDGRPGQDGFADGAGGRAPGGAAPSCEGPGMVYDGGRGGEGSGRDDARATDGASGDNGGGGGGGAGCVAVRSVVLPSVPTYPTASSVLATAAPQAD
jgi:hypothetical protein